MEKSKVEVKSLQQEAEDAATQLAMNPGITGIVIIVEEQDGSISVTRRVRAPTHLLGLLTAVSSMVRKSFSG